MRWNSKRARRQGRSGETAFSLHLLRRMSGASGEELLRMSGQYVSRLVTISVVLPLGSCLVWEDRTTRVMVSG